MVQEAANGLYDLGPFALRLGYAAMARRRPIKAAEQALERYVAATGETAMLSVWTEHGPMVVQWLQGLRPVYSTIAVGSIMPLTRSATGFAFLAHLDARLTDPLLRRAPDEDEAELAAQAVRRLGYAAISDGFIPGLSAVACPILDPAGSPVAVLTAVSANRRFSDSEIAAVKAHAADAMTALGVDPV